MVRHASAGALLVLGLAFWGSGSATASKTTPAEGPAPRLPEATAGSLRRVSFAYEVSWSRLPKNLKSMDFWVPIPWNDSAQSVSDLVFQSPGTISTASEAVHGNTMYYGVSGPRGGVPYNVTMRCVVERKAIRFDDLARRPATAAEEPANLGQYLKGDRLAPLDAGIRSKAATIAGSLKADPEKARAIYDHVAGSMKLVGSGEQWGQGDLAHIMEHMAGSSFDVSTLFVSLLRASGIPARTAIGFQLPVGAREGFLSRTHAWAEFWLPGFGWVPADPALAIAHPQEKDRWFGRLDENRIQISVGRDVVLVPPQKGDPLNYFIYPYAQGDGLPLGGSSYRFSFDPPPAPPVPPTITGP